MKLQITFLLSVLLLISFASAVLINNPKLPLVQPAINYSLLPTVNNSMFLNGHPDTYFYQASNPAGYITSSGNINSSTYTQCWSTLEGIKCDVIDILGSEITNDFQWLTGRYTMPNNLLIWLRFDDYNSTHVLDYSGNNNNGIFNGSSITWGLVGESLSRGRLCLDNICGNWAGSNPTFDNAFTDRSYSLWFMSATAGSYEILFEEGGTSNGVTIYLIGNVVYFYSTCTNCAPSYTNYTYANFHPYIWNHVVAVMDGGSKLLLYVNGENIMNSTISSGMYSHVGDDFIGGSLEIVATASGVINGTTATFNGLLEDFMVFNKTLNNSEILEIYRNQLPDENINNTEFKGESIVTKTAKFYNSHSDNASIDELLLNDGNADYFFANILDFNTLIAGSSDYFGSLLNTGWAITDTGNEMASIYSGLSGQYITCISCVSYLDSSGDCGTDWNNYAYCTFRLNEGWI